MIFIPFRAFTRPIKTTSHLDILYTYDYAATHENQSLHGRRSLHLQLMLLLLLLLLLQLTRNLLLIVVDEGTVIGHPVDEVADHHSDQANPHEEQTFLLVALAQFGDLFLTLNDLASEDRDESHGDGLEESHTGICHP